ncbi:MAG: amidohydrolase [Chitinophagaceae bacterium]|nr:amidohydrolase [Chitinophagaceae bacterium]
MYTYILTRFFSNFIPYSFIGLSFLFISCTKKQADFIVYNATIYTVNEKFEVAHVAVVKDGKFIAVGGDSLLSLYEATNKVDAKQQFIYPGFIDAHCHFTGYSLDQYKLNLYGTKSFNEIVAKIIEYAKTNQRTWIEGRLWDQHDWEGKRFPTKDTLDKLFPSTPIFLMRIDGHAVLCNQKALDLAHITDTTSVEQGVIEKRQGKLTGILIDKAVSLVQKVIPSVDKELASTYFGQTEKECFSVGLTSVVDCGLENDWVKWLQYAFEHKGLKVRIAGMLMNDEKNIQEYLHQEPLWNDQFHLIGFKVFADGSLGSRGAHLLQEYQDQHGHTGYALISVAELKKLTQQVIQSKYQLNIHAIGDATNHEALTLYSEVLTSNNDRRWRIEHAQLIAPEDFSIFGRYHIIPSVQPTHATSDMSWVEQRIGAHRMPYAYAYQNLLKQNDWLPLGTDFPVEPLNPLGTFYAAVFRQDEHQLPVEGFQMSNALTREQALRGMTIWAAKSVFEENKKGSIEVGKMADFVILPLDIMKASSKEIIHAKVLATYLGGEKVYSK